MSWFDTTQIGRIQLELTNYCNAFCPQCDRAELISQYDKWTKRATNNLNNNHITLQNVKDWFGPYEWDNLRFIHYCGNVDEPTINPEMIEITKWLQTICNPNTTINIASNGGTRNKAFWQELGEISANSRINVTFGIDGLEDTNHIYRKNVNWEKLQENFRTFIKAGGNAFWQFIVFDHNKHQLDEIKQRLDNEGFKGLKLLQSNRLDIPGQKEVNIVKKVKVPKWHNTTNGDKMDGKSVKKLRDEGKTLSCVKCPAKLKSKNTAFHKEYGNIYISARGYVTPCCWMGNPTELIKLWDSNSNIDPKLHNLYDNNLDDIINGNWWNHIDSQMQDYKLCVMKCKELQGDTHI
jgi:hypothetical protein